MRNAMWRSSAAWCSTCSWCACSCSLACPHPAAFKTPSLLCVPAMRPAAIENTIPLSLVISVRTVSSPLMCTLFR